MNCCYRDCEHDAVVRMTVTVYGASGADPIAVPFCPAHATHFGWDGTPPKVVELD